MRFVKPILIALGIIVATSLSGQSAFPAPEAALQKHPQPWQFYLIRLCSRLVCMQHALSRKMAACGAHTSNKGQYP